MGLLAQPGLAGSTIIGILKAGDPAKRFQQIKTVKALP